MFRPGDAIRADFPMLRRRIGGCPTMYLDNASSTPVPAAVLDAMRDHYTIGHAVPGPGHRLSVAAADAYEHGRAVVQRAVHAEHPDEIVFTTGTSAAIGLLAATYGRRVVHAGDRVVVAGPAPDATVLPWRRLCAVAGAELVVAPGDRSGTVTAARLAEALDERVRLVAVTHVSGDAGTVQPVRALTAVARRHGIPVVVDGAHAAGHRPVDVRELGADFYAFSGHKAYGPAGVGVLYGRRELLAAAPFGPVDVAAVSGLAAALAYLEKLGRPNVREHTDALVRTAVRLFGPVPGVRVLGDPAADPAGIVSITVAGVHPYDVAHHLARHGIAVRGGAGAVRFSFGVHNLTEELQIARRALATVRPGMWTDRHRVSRAASGGSAAARVHRRPPPPRPPR